MIFIMGVFLVFPTHQPSKTLGRGSVTRARMLTSLLEDHYQEQYVHLMRDNRRQRDALRIDDEAKARLFKLARHHVDNPVVASLANEGPEYMLRLLSVVYGIEHERIVTHNVQLQDTLVDLGKQLIEERNERTLLEARLAAQEERHRFEKANDIRMRQTMLDRAHVAACAAMTPISASDKNPHLQAARELFIHHAEVVRTILL
jgi:hypothetical protein